jgi:hypothetical protein
MKGQVMLDNDCWSHYCPNGRSPWEFFKDAGYGFVFAGENLAEGFVNINNVMEAWMNSKTHRENLLNSSFNEVGFGIIKGSFQSNANNIIVVVHFGNSGQPKIDQSSEIQVYYPEEGAIISGNEIDVKGSVQNADGIEIYVNNEKKSEGTILNGEFTSRVQNVQEGEYSLQARGVDFNGNPLTSQTVNFSVEADVDSSIKGLTLLQGIFPSIDPVAKNAVNLIFVLVIALIFLIDFIAISRTKVLSKDKSFSHFHFAVFIILASIIIIGGFGGQIAEGLGIS